MTSESKVWDVVCNELKGEFVKPLHVTTGKIYGMGELNGKPFHSADDDMTRRIPRPGTKAEQVRKLIMLAKSSNIDMQAIVTQAIAELDMSRSLASAYVRDNWDRV